jgi:hypothetical protein
MNIAALIAWIVTAGGGFYLLATWVAEGATAGRPERAIFHPP